MENLFKHIPSVRNLFALAAFISVAIVFLLKETLLDILKIGGNDALSLVVFFLIILLVVVFGGAAYYSMMRKEVDLEKTKAELDAGRKIANVEGSKKAKATMKNTAGEANVKGSDEAEVNFEDDPPAGEKKNLTNNTLDADITNSPNSKIQNIGTQNVYNQPLTPSSHPANSITSPTSTTWIKRPLAEKVT